MVGDLYMLLQKDVSFLKLAYTFPCNDRHEATLLSPQAVKLYTGGNHIEILPTADQLTISVNDQIVTSPHEGYQHLPRDGNHVFK
jgi:hypothetical protein